MDTTTLGTRDNLLRLAADIVAAYVRRNEVSSNKLPPVITSVYQVLTELEHETDEAFEDAPRPAITISRSVQRSRIVCLEDGKAFKALKRHLRTAHRMTPEEYRSKWGLQNDYPMVAPDYSVKRSELAKKMGLGQKAGVVGTATRKKPAAA